MDSQNPAVSVSREGSVALVRIDYAPVNALSRPVRQGLLDAARALAADDSVTAVVLHGGSGRFIAGADIKEMDLPPDEPILPDVIRAIEAIPQPVVAAIDGVALGGGLEIAMACDLRLATPKASVGLVETRLGILPGSGGTQRLPRLVGTAKAIELIGEAKILRAPEAAKLGIIDGILEGELLAEAVRLAPGAAKRHVSALPIPPADPAAVEAAAQSALKKAKGVPAIPVVVELLRETAGMDFEAGLKREREVFLPLRASAEAAALRHLFLAEREASRVPGLKGVTPRAVGHVAVIGGGTMGSGIAMAVADAGLPVTVIERDARSAAACAARLRDAYGKQAKSGRLTDAAAAEHVVRITPTEDWNSLALADLIIEAAFEDLTVKEDIFRRLDAVAKPGAVLATNTSYLDPDEIAAFTNRPQDVLGLHFFAPANIMKLLEVVRGAKTAPGVLATGLAFGKKLGKLPIVSGVCEGFIGNRIYAVYRRHAEYLVEDGASPREVDAAMESYGFAMGIFAVGDMSGLDIAWAMRKRRAATRDPGERYVAIPDRLCEAGRLGRKTGAGWYSYASGKAEPDPAVDAIIAAEREAAGITPRRFTAEEIQNRLLAVMANEGAKIVAEGISLRPSDIDLVFTNGYGFPRIKGGPLFAADQRGLRAVLAEVEAAAEAGGVGSEPAPLLRELAEAGSTFKEWQRGRAAPG
ncbi:3-hydroxyacyl-CoA dehydrogenase NAD-binding domain-containing protein [Roseomonas marmotae]|uniref:Enoyl-CoA hydratase/isomerase family protein n=1 Tax=Roseomonas marmotae TaxID=2768161 RepID=A0ABS3KCM3_9PROT|nr:3-hydroxyacyl-CoA dehydrogenase NAD-binding domain-containing protein [Roseomonas marmotae]MBO1074106.1 enoyl-CoA hydratase/isomerase family protein [Roseomonas marmotae]QTI78888.1 enoyl-CoA hydratase/isomerase family protein [Roseomonas marmotae]